MYFAIYLRGGQTVKISIPLPNNQQPDVFIERILAEIDAARLRGTDLGLRGSMQQVDDKGYVGKYPMHLRISGKEIIGALGEQ